MTGFKEGINKRLRVKVVRISVSILLSLVLFVGLSGCKRQDYVLSSAVFTAENVILSGEILTNIFREQEEEFRYQLLEKQVAEIGNRYRATGLSVALIENGEVTRTYGYKDAIKASTAMTPDTKIRIASVTKVFVSMIGFKMMEEGIINLDSGIGEYWGFPISNPLYPNDPISFRSIFTHTSSISEIASYSGIEDKLRRNMVFRSVKPLDPAGCNYCNYAFAVAGATLEKAGKKVLDDLADEYFFTPLDIDAAFASGNIENKEQLAQLYYAGGTTARSIASLSQTFGSAVPGMNGNFAVGGLCISARDMAKLIGIIANDGVYEGRQYFQKETIELMETPFCETDYHGVKAIQCMPLKYMENIYGRNGLYFHSGSAYGVYSLVSYDPQTKDGIVVISTGASGTLDEYGIYAVCGEISKSFYTSKE